MTTALVLCADYAGLQAQALGLAERAGRTTRVQTLAATRWFAEALFQSNYILTPSLRQFLR